MSDVVEYDQLVAFLKGASLIVFMYKHSMTTANSQKVIFNVHRLENIFDQSLSRILE